MCTRGHFYIIVLPAVLQPTVNWEIVARHKGYMDEANTVIGTCASGIETFTG